jgi:hypothetical protein
MKIRAFLSKNRVHLHGEIVALTGPFQRLHRFDLPNNDLFPLVGIVEIPGKYRAFLLLIIVLSIGPKRVTISFLAGFSQIHLDQTAKGL